MEQINFKGGFLIKKPTRCQWEQIKDVLPKKKCVFETFNDEGDKFFAIKSCYDEDMAKYILNQKFKFAFYPNINLKSRLDTYFPEEAHKVIDAQTDVIINRKELRKFLVSNQAPFSVPKYRWKPNDHIEKTYSALGLNPSECKTKIKDGITYIFDKNGKNIAKASPNNEKGVNFVYIYPKNHDDPSQRFALSQGGERYDFSAMEIIDFQKKFLQNIKIDKGRTYPQK